MKDERASTEAVSLEDQVAYARQHEPGVKGRDADGGDEITGLRDLCKTFIDAMALRLGEGRAHQIAMSRSMLEQMIFWLRAAKQ
jgi:hypothetical protein